MYFWDQITLTIQWVYLQQQQKHIIGFNKYMLNSFPKLSDETIVKWSFFEVVTYIDLMSSPPTLSRQHEILQNYLCLLLWRKLIDGKAVNVFVLQCTLWDVTGLFILMLVYVSIFPNMVISLSEAEVQATHCLRYLFEIVYCSMICGLIIWDRIL